MGNPTAHINLTNSDQTVLVDGEDFDWLNRSRWRLHPDGYAYRQEYTDQILPSGRRRLLSIMMHRVIMGTPSGLDTDHINRNGLDNRRANLRIVDRTQNNYNTGLRVTNTSGHKGVSWNKRTKSWRAYIGGTKGRIELGHFKKIEDAIAARAEAEAKVIKRCA